MKSRTSLFTTILLIFVSGAAFGQSVWYEPQDGHLITLEYARPQFIEGILSGATSGTWFFGAQIKASPGVQILLDLPLAISVAGGDEGYPWYYYDRLRGQTALGNPLLAVQLGSTRTAGDIEFGFRFPIMKEDKGDAALVGVASDFERTGAFLPDVVSAYGHGAYTFQGTTSPLRLRLGGGMSAWFPTEGRGDDDPELFTDLFAQLWLHTPQYTMGPVLAGRTWITPGDYAEDFPEMSEFFLGFTATGHFNNVHPSLHAHFQLDNQGPTSAGEFVNYVIGFNLAIGLEEKAD